MEETKGKILAYQTDPFLKARHISINQCMLHKTRCFGTISFINVIWNLQMTWTLQNIIYKMSLSTTIVFLVLMESKQLVEHPNLIQKMKSWKTKMNNISQSRARNINEWICIQSYFFNFKVSYELYFKLTTEKLFTKHLTWRTYILRYFTSYKNSWIWEFNIQIITQSNTKSAAAFWAVCNWSILLTQNVRIGLPDF